MWVVFSLFLYFLISLSHSHLTARRSKPSPGRPQSSQVSWPVSQLQVKRCRPVEQLSGLLALETLKSLCVNVWVHPERWLFEIINFRHKYLIIYLFCQFPVEVLLVPVMVTGDAEVRGAGMPTGVTVTVDDKRTNKKKKKKRDFDNHSMIRGVLVMRWCCLLLPLTLMHSLHTAEDMLMKLLALNFFRCSLVLWG